MVPTNTSAVRFSGASFSTDLTSLGRAQAAAPPLRAWGFGF